MKYTVLRLGFIILSFQLSLFEFNLTALEGEDSVE